MLLRYRIENLNSFGGMKSHSIFDSIYSSNCSYRQFVRLEVIQFCGVSTVII